DKNAQGIDFLFEKNEVEGVKGLARLVGENEVEVGTDGKTKAFRAPHIIVATGSVPREVPTAPADGKRILNSDHILKIAHVPDSLVVLGAGAVGIEFASIFASFGSSVTIVEMLPNALPLEDLEVSQELERAFRKRKIKLLTGTKLAAVEEEEGVLRLRIESEDLSEWMEANTLLVAVGRAPVTEKLGLEEQGVELDEGYVCVNEFMQTSVPTIYAIGDVVQTPWLAHVASAEGILAVEHLIGRDVRPINYDQVPGVTFCQPEVGSVGLTEKVARERGYDVATGRFPFSALAKAAIEGSAAGFVKVVRDKKYDELLGVHVIGPHATEMIAEACVALRLESTTEELFRAMHAHPTMAEAVAEAAHAAVDRAIHM
ncbi:MAG: dihydrolipoyl dehydrogenase, partial [Thermoanaerobaculia bacterium]